MAEIKDELNEVILTERKALEYKTNDDELVKAIDKAVSESKELKDEIDKIGDKNTNFWKGKQLDVGEIHPKKAKIIDNRLFMAIETMIPILTSDVPEPQIEGNIDNDVRERIIKVLKIAYEVKQKFQRKLRKFIRYWMLRRIGVIKYRWDKEGGFITEVPNPKKIGFDPLVDNINDAEFVYEWMEDTLEDLTKKFPNAKTKILNKYGEDSMKSKAKYLEFWGGKGEWVCWKLGDIILDKKKNPNFDYTGETKTKVDSYGNEIKQNSKNNLFKKPKFPYIIGTYFQLGDQIYDNTSLIEQGIPLQEGINKRKNQISDLIDLNKRVWVASSLAVSEEDFQAFLNKTGENGLYMTGGDISQIQAISGRLEPIAQTDLAHSMGEIDNILGVHATTRGERKEQETLGGRQLLQQADYSRLGAIMEDIVEQTVEDWYNAYLHMLKVYGQEDFEFNNGEETIKLNRDEIPEGIVIMVKRGSTVPMDRSSRMQMAQQLAATQMIDPETLFEEMSYPNPQKRVEKLYEYWRLIGKIAPQQPPTPPMPQGIPPQGVEAPAQGGGEEVAIAQEQLAKLKQIISSDEFQALPDEEKQAKIQEARQVAEEIKGRVGV